MGTQRVITTVRVVLHVTEHGGLAVGILTSEHRGAVRLDRRYCSARPGERRLPPRRPGVDPVLQAAWEALGALLDEQQAAQGTDGR